MSDLKEIKNNFLLLVRNSYPFAKNDRGNEYATYEDFENRYIKKYPEEVYMNALLNAFSGCLRYHYIFFAIELLFLVCSDFFAPMHF